MPMSDLLMNGFELMLLGMGIVFTFLMILVVALNLMSRIAFHFDTSEEQPTATPITRTMGKPENTALIAVISAAISRYRSANTQH
ncbi:MAG: hypothetical protein HKP55_11735 [Gammaproteobacteria bacterium]|nr:hypothetical protein [Gammaproteobacteria bacterium]